MASDEHVPFIYEKNGRLTGSIHLNMIEAIETSLKMVKKNKKRHESEHPVHVKPDPMVTLATVSNSGAQFEDPKIIQAAVWRSDSRTANCPVRLRAIWRNWCLSGLRRLIRTLSVFEPNWQSLQEVQSPLSLTLTVVDCQLIQKENIKNLENVPTVCPFDHQAALSDFWTWTCFS